MDASPLDPERVASAFKALGQPQRLQMVALLARRPHYGEELAEFLGLSAPTVSHHLQRLRLAGLLIAERQTPYVLYRLDPDRMAELGQQLGRSRELADRLGLPSEEELSDHVLRRLLDEEGRLRELPASRRLRAVALRWAADHFETGRIYPEREVHRVLMGLHGDIRGLREALVERGWLQRAGGVYRRLEGVEVE